MSWRVDWMLGALALVCFGVSKSVLPYLEKLSSLSEGFEAKNGDGDHMGENLLLILAALLALGFVFRVGYRIFGKKEPLQNDTLQNP